MPCIDNKRGLCIALTLCMDIIVFLVRAKEKVAHRRPQASGFASLFVPTGGGTGPGPARARPGKTGPGSAFSRTRPGPGRPGCC